jgi:hypothetical protein
MPIKQQGQKMKDDFKIAKDGTIQRNKIPEIRETKEDALMSEYYSLEYQVCHMTRPTKDPAKIARFEELKKILGINNSKLNFAAAKKKIGSKTNISDLIKMARDGKE